MSSRVILGFVTALALVLVFVLIPSSTTPEVPERLPSSTTPEVPERPHGQHGNGGRLHGAEGGRMGDFLRTHPREAGDG